MYARGEWYWTPRLVTLAVKAASNLALEAVLDENLT